LSRLWHRLQGARFGRIVLYGSTRSLVEALMGVRGILLAGMLGPLAFGVWALFRLILTYGNFAGLGLLRGLELEVAKARADQDDGRRQAWGRTAAGCMLAIFGSIAILTLIAGGLVDEPWLRELLWAVSIGLLLERLWFYGLSFMRASGSLRRFALLELAQAAAQVLLTLALGYFFGLSGAFVGFALANLAALLLLREQVPLRPELNPARLKTMFAVGLPLSASQLLSAMLATVDRLVAGAWLGLAALGQYAFAVSVASLGVSAALVVKTVVFPDLYGRVDREGAVGITREHLDRTIRPYVLLLAPVAGAGVLALGLVVARLLPEYAAAVQPAAVFVFVGIAQGVVNLAVVAVVAARQQRVLPLITLAALVVNAGLATGALVLGYGMVGLAAGAVVARLVYAGGVVMLVAHGARTAPLVTAVRTLWPIAWCAAATALVSHLVPPRDLASCAAALAWYLTAIAPVLVLLALALRRRLPISAG
jgi:O-antigen/teichoic acid export membrane protein